MRITNLELLGFVVTCIVLGTAGYYCRKWFSHPVRIITWILLLLGTFLAQYFAPSARILDIFGFRVFANSSVMAFGCGLLIGLIRREYTTHSSTISTKT